MKFRSALPLILLIVGACSGFQTDELEDESGSAEIGLKSWRTETILPVDSPVSPNVVPSSPSSSLRPPANKKVEFALEHSVDGLNFQPAGLFTARVRESLKGKQTLLKFRISRNPFSIEEKKAFQVLLENDELYRVRVPVNLLSPDEGGYALASVKARCLVLSNFQERFDFHLDQGQIIGLTYSGSNTCPYPRPLQIPSEWVFSSDIVPKSSEQASRLLIDVDAFGTTGDEVEVGDDGTPLKKLPERSFWSKYWMYIVPLGFIVLNAISQAANIADEGAPGQGATGQRSTPGGQTVRRR